MKLFKKLFNWFKTKNRIIRHAIEHEEMFKEEAFQAIQKLEELDQSKVYAIVFQDATSEDLDVYTQIVKSFEKRMKWSLPKIMFINREIKEVSLKELEEAIKIKQRRR